MKRTAHSRHLNEPRKKGDDKRSRKKQKLEEKNRKKEDKTSFRRNRKVCLRGDTFSDMDVITQDTNSIPPSVACIKNWLKTQLKNKTNEQRVLLFDPTGTIMIDLNRNRIEQPIKNNIYEPIRAFNRFVKNNVTHLQNGKFAAILNNTIQIFNTRSGKLDKPILFNAEVGEPKAVCLFNNNKFLVAFHGPKRCYTFIIDANSFKHVGTVPKNNNFTQLFSWDKSRTFEAGFAAYQKADNKLHVYEYDAEKERYNGKVVTLEVPCSSSYMFRLPSGKFVDARNNTISVFNENGSRSGTLSFKSTCGSTCMCDNHKIYGHLELHDERILTYGKAHFMVWDKKLTEAESIDTQMTVRYAKQMQDGGVLIENESGHFYCVDINTKEMRKVLEIPSYTGNYLEPVFLTT